MRSKELSKYLEVAEYNINRANTIYQTKYKLTENTTRNTIERWALRFIAFIAGGTITAILM
jgi:hypothetical protein